MERDRWQVPDLDDDRRVIGGVAAGIAREVDVDPLLVRVGFALLAFTSAFGVVLYAATWGYLAWRRSQGLEPRRPPQPKGETPAHRVTGVVAITVGLAIVAASSGPPVSWNIWLPLTVAALGAAIAWQRGQPADEGGDLVRVGLGIGLAVLGSASLAFLNVDLGAAMALAAALVIAGLGVALLVGPWAVQTIRTLTAERAARIRESERAEVAAHLHDSVLQTLALIQRSAEDPAETVRLARRQERELRQWLFAKAPAAGSLRDGLAGIVDEVEAAHGVAVEAVVVGDAEPDDAVVALLGAAREAVVNAARHSGAAQIDVYAEARPDAIEIFVRDAGAGFDPARVGPDRHGLRESVVGRVERAGGSVVVTSAVGQGTEVEMRVRRPASKQPADTAGVDA